LGGSSSYAYAINDNGLVAGFSYTTGNAEVHACLWSYLPITTATLNPAPNAAGWNRQNTTVSLQATDRSGVQSLTYSASGAQNILSTNVLGSSVLVEIDREGITTLTFYATNILGNNESPKNITIKLDRTAPHTTASLAGGKVTLSATDNLSGVQ